MNKSIQFLVVLLAILGGTFVLHTLALQAQELPMFDHKIVLAYSINFVLAVLILILVQRNMTEGSAKGGFIFFLGSGLKFLVFFLVFYPSYKADGETQTIEFITFFVPYAICLILEVYYLSKQLNNQSS